MPTSNAHTTSYFAKGGDIPVHLGYLPCQQSCENVPTTIPESKDASLGQCVFQMQDLWVGMGSVVADPFPLHPSLSFRYKGCYPAAMGILYGGSEINVSRTIKTEKWDIKDREMLDSCAPGGRCD